MCGAAGWILLFSAHAEVFPVSSTLTRNAGSLLRARGGISEEVMDSMAAWSSSPRTRRYFPERSAESYQQELFSAHAEVFPTYYRIQSQDRPLLRARGGISILYPRVIRMRRSSPRTRRYFLFCAGM